MFPFQLLAASLSALLLLLVALVIIGLSIFVVAHVKIAREVSDLKETDPELWHLVHQFDKK